MAGIQRRPKRVTRSKVVAALDTAFSIWTRKSGADHTGRAECYTCGVRKQYMEMDAGHFQTRAKYATRWDVQNVKPQCKHCNMTNGGHQYEFALHLDREYGPGTADAVVARSNQPARFTTATLVEMTEMYRRMTRELGGNLG